MIHIPIKFEYEGKIFSGYFASTQGSGGNVWQLLIDKYFYGILVINDQWVFHGNKLGEKFSELADFLGDYLIAWYE
jgi:hypothetical protein